MPGGSNGGQPSVTVVEISDPAVAGEGLELVDLDAVKLSSTPFRARRVMVRLEGAAVLYHSTNHRVRTRTKIQPGLFDDHPEHRAAAQVELVETLLATLPRSASGPSSTPSNRCWG